METVKWQTDRQNGSEISSQITFPPISNPIGIKSPSNGLANGNKYNPPKERGTGSIQTWLTTQPRLTGILTNNIPSSGNIKTLPGYRV